MKYIIIGVILILLGIIAGLCLKIHLLHKSMREISRGMSEKLSSDTNTPICISSEDKQIKELAGELNIQLKILREQRLQYLDGDRELKEAVTNISHDLRTPLTSVFGYLSLLKDMEKSDEVTRCTDCIENRAESMKALTGELLNFSVLLSRGEPELSKTSINGTLEEGIASFYGALTAANITPEITMPETTLYSMLNRAALTRIIENILNNALKYSDGDLKITLSQSGEMVFSNRSSALDELTVCRLFDRFYTVEAARKSTGLGLSIAKLLTEEMNGNISAGIKDGVFSIALSFPLCEG